MIRAVAVLPVVAVVLAMVLAPSPAMAQTVREQTWYLDPLRLDDAHDVARGAGVTVAVVDSGVDPTVPSLSGQVLPGSQFGLTDSPSGMADTDDSGHGTSMSGLIAGKGAGYDQSVGIAPGARILPIAVNLSDSRYLADAIRWAVDHGAKVANLSLAGESPAADERVIDAVRYAQQRDVVVVFAAGNVEKTGKAVSAYARIPGVLAVSGTAPGSSFWTGSAYGRQVEIAAPASQLIMPVPKTVYSSGFAIGDGTSGAAAIVSGTAALIRSRFPSLDAANTINRIIRTARDLGAPGKDDQFGNGLIQPLDAMTRAVPPVTTNPLGDAGGTPESVAPSVGIAPPSGPAPRDPNRRPAVAQPERTAGQDVGSGLLVGGLIAAACVVAVLIVGLLLRGGRRPSTSAAGGVGPYGGVGPPGSGFPGFGPPGSWPSGPDAGYPPGAGVPPGPVSPGPVSPGPMPPGAVPPGVGASANGMPPSGAPVSGAGGSSGSVREAPAPPGEEPPVNQDGVPVQARHRLAAPGSPPRYLGSTRRPPY